MRPGKDVPVKILIINDNPLEQYFISEILEGNEVILHVVNSAFEAVGVHDKSFYSLIIVDIDMPHMSWFELLKFLWEGEKTRHIPVLFFSKKEVSDELKSKAYAMGAMDILSMNSNQVSLRGHLNALVRMISYRKKVLVEKNGINTSLKEDRLLINSMSPESVFNHTKEAEKTISRIQKNATVLLSGFSSFMELTKQEDKKAIIKKMDAYNSVFDKIVERYGVEKIRNIGDSCFYVGGIPIRNKTNPHVMVLIALEMKDYCNYKAAQDQLIGKVPWYIKFGISTGEAIFRPNPSIKDSYDVWGKAVNVSNRLKGMATKNSILISESTKTIIEDYFEIRSLGKHLLNDLDEQEIFEVIRLKEQYALDLKCNFPNEFFFTDIYQKSFEPGQFPNISF